MFTPPITAEDLYSSTLTPKIDPDWVACQGILVLNLTKYADKWINITIAAVDLTGNIGEQVQVDIGMKTCARIMLHTARIVVIRIVVNECDGVIVEDEAGVHSICSALPDCHTQKKC